MGVEFVAAEFVHELQSRVSEARGRAAQAFAHVPPPGAAGEAEHWEQVLEANAREVLGILRHTHLAPGVSVRYRYYEQSGGVFRVRPFVARPDTDVTAVKRVLAWHPPPDARRGSAPTVDRDVDLLYRHFTIERSAAGLFEYWVAMQELWASSEWAHARVLATAEELSALLARPDWRSELTPDHCAPAVIEGGDGAFHLVALVYTAVRQHAVHLEQVQIGRDLSLHYQTPVLVALGPRGYLV
jgi:hypothetical protein